MVSANTRKRPAPGASPQHALTRSLSHQQMPLPADAQGLSDEAFLKWGDQNFTDPLDTINRSLYNSNLADLQRYPNQLVRRNTNQLLKPFNGAEDAPLDEEAALDKDAAQAKLDHAAHRKPIPPFVQKLAKFLNDAHNSALIRWSDDGRSFIVLDEDEFAKKLIPEMFKHNNYASFVRQLNMYGFHKRVGLTDNSMRASERKAKTPSEYSHRFFRQDKPDWLFLITKPKNQATKGRTTRSRKAAGSDEEGEGEDEYIDQAQAVRNDANGSLVAKPGAEVEDLRKQISLITSNQQLIAQKFSELRNENAKLYQQAQHWQELHSRHENSINAILSFLATVYNRSLEQGSPQNITQFFGGGIPYQDNKANIINVSEYDESSPQDAVQLRRRQPLRLQAPPSTESPTPGFTRDPIVSKSGPQQSGSIEEIPDINSGPTPETDDWTNRDFMSVLNSTANTPSNVQYDLPGALEHFQNTNNVAPLTPRQRNNMLNLIAAGNTDSNDTNNALTTPTPPPMPSIDALNNGKTQLDELQKQIAQQNAQVRNLASQLSPLSPSGSIPGLTQPYAGESPAPSMPPLDLDQYFDTGNYFNGDNFNFDPENFTFEDGTQHEGTQTQTEDLEEDTSTPAKKRRRK